MDMASGKDRRMAPEPSGQTGRDLVVPVLICEAWEWYNPPSCRTVQFRSLANKETVHANTGGLPSYSRYFIDAEPAPVAEGFLRFPLRKIKS